VNLGIPRLIVGYEYVIVIQGTDLDMWRPRAAFVWRSSAPQGSIVKGQGNTIIN